jgi:hypothetical protein
LENTDYRQPSSVVSRHKAFCKPVFSNVDMALLDLGEEDRILAKI